MNHLATALAPIGAMINEARAAKTPWDRVDAILYRQAQDAYDEWDSVKRTLPAFNGCWPHGEHDPQTAEQMLDYADATFHALHALAKDAHAAESVMAEAVSEMGPMMWQMVTNAIADHDHLQAGQIFAEVCQDYVRSLMAMELVKIDPRLSRECK